MKSLLIALLAMGSVGTGQDFLSIGASPRYPKTPKERNKLGLTDEDRELMSSMTPKEKKKYLKGLRK